MHLAILVAFVPYVSNVSASVCVVLREIESVCIDVNFQQIMGILIQDITYGTNGMATGISLASHPTHLSTPLCACACALVHVRVCMCACEHMYLRVCICACACEHMRVYARACNTQIC